MKLSYKETEGGKRQAGFCDGAFSQQVYEGWVVGVVGEMDLDSMMKRTIKSNKSTGCQMPMLQSQHMDGNTNDQGPNARHKRDQPAFCMLSVLTDTSVHTWKDTSLIESGMCQGLRLHTGGSAVPLVVCSQWHTVLFLYELPLCLGPATRGL